MYEILVSLYVNCAISLQFSTKFQGGSKPVPTNVCKLKNECQKTEERTFMLECIEVYKSLPALWNVKSKEYSNRQKTNDACDVINTFREKYPEATREDVTKKFNSLRTNYGRN